MASSSSLEWSGLAVWSGWFGIGSFGLFTSEIPRLTTRGCELASGWKALFFSRWLLAAAEAGAAAAWKRGEVLGFERQEDLGGRLGGRLRVVVGFGLRRGARRERDGALG